MSTPNRFSSGTTICGFYLREKRQGISAQSVLSLRNLWRKQMIALNLRGGYTRTTFEARVELFSFDEVYLKRLRERDLLTEQHFVAYFSKLLHIKLRSRLRSSQAVEDIRQETFVRVLKAVQAKNGIHQPERLGAFVNSICNNVMQEFFRSSARGVPLDEQSADPPDVTIDLDGMLVTRQTGEQVRRVLDQLPEKDRQLLRAIFLEEKNKDEVCREFGVSRDYLRVLLHRAKQNFRVFFEKGEGGGEFGLSKSAEKA